MPEQIVKRRSRGFICVNAHPEGCRRNVERWATAVRGRTQPGARPPRNVLVIGASTGYGLASRVVAGFGYGAKTLGVFFESAPQGDKIGTAGYYNTAAFHALAGDSGLFAASLNGDAFANASKSAAAEIIRKQMGSVDLVIYSLAAPKRIHPDTGVTHSSALKPLLHPLTSKTVELDSEKVTQVTLHTATAAEMAHTVAVMGGDDWQRWVAMLLEEKLLAEGARTIAYSYIGPEITWPIYRHGTIGLAKQDLEEAARALDAELRARCGGQAQISVNKAVVTQASAAIPIVPLYLSLLPPALARRDFQEGPLEQMERLFAEFIAADAPTAHDAENRIRLDDRELRPEVQEEIMCLWPQVTTENLRALTDFAGYQRDFRRLFGFEVDGVDYDAPVETDLRW
jgi:enoyl-[acyl-carrier protein] reductase / trans-2-enoyl-CoA reductase (NAD+)